MKNCSIVAIAVLIFVSFATSSQAYPPDDREPSFLHTTNNGPKPVTSVQASPEPSDVLSIVRSILDEKASNQDRNKAIEENPGLAADLITAMVSNVKVGSEQESRLIPWLWKVAMLAGKNNDKEEIARVLDVSLPRNDKPLSRWQATVIGGGVVNGLSIRGVNPAERIQEIVSDDALLEDRWQRSLGLAERMLEDKLLPSGTRYDTLRMIGMDSWENVEGVLRSFIKDADEPELQSGAVAALVDMRNENATDLILSSFDSLSSKHQETAVNALLGNHRQTLQLLEAIQDGTLKPETLNSKQILTLRSHDHYSIRDLISELFPLEVVSAAKTAS